ncbi:GSCFA domain-containing protein [bacterium]|nr:GSCFA domain-containing protein [bacterium]
MLKFKLDFEIPKVPIIHDFGKVFMLGSCFAENQSNYFNNFGFDCNSNPFGTIYNPHSIALLLNRIQSLKPYREAEYNSDNGMYFHYDHHGSMSRPDLQNAVHVANNELEASRQHIERSEIAVITLGTSLVFKLVDSERIVANCHKQKAALFTQEFLDNEAILNSLGTIEMELRAINPGIHIIWTISPVRHVRSGLEHNFISKSRLRVALDQHLQNKENQYYFPSYEIVMDELRDYRFFKEDMVHPNDLAQQYVWDRFVDTYFEKELRSKLEEVEAFRKFEQHRPRQNQEQHEAEIEKKRTSLKNKYPSIHI